MFLYIDPGTGSMLFSVLIGAAATLYFLARAALLKLKVLFAGKSSANDKARRKFVIYSEDARYWNVFRPVLDAFENHGVKIAYFSSDKNDPIFSAAYKFVEAQFIGEGNAAFARLNLLSADIVLATTPGLGVYQWKRSRNVRHYAHVMHALSDGTMYRMFGIDFFDSVLLPAKNEYRRNIRFLEKSRGIKEKELVAVGCTYLDVFKKKIDSIPNEENHEFTVLVCPSWGEEAILSKYGEKLLDPLVETGWKIIVRPHPQSKKSETEILTRLEKKYEGENFFWDFERDNIYSLKKADAMISDFSSVIYDYAFLFDRPVIYVNAQMDLRPYDADDLEEKKIWTFETVKKIGIELKEEDFSNIKSVIQNASDSPELKAARKAAKDEAWQFQGEAGEKIAQFMMRKEEEIAKALQEKLGGEK